MNPRRARRRARSLEHRRRARVASAIREAVRLISPDLAAHKIPRTKINWGWCMDLAEAASQLLLERGVPVATVNDDPLLCRPDTTLHEGGWSHEWIWAYGYHFDSEAPLGVRDWRQLPHFRRWACSDYWPAVRVVPAMSRDREVAMLSTSAKLVLKTFNSIREAERGL